MDPTAGTSNGGGRTGTGPEVAAGTRATMPRLPRRDPAPSGNPVPAEPGAAVTDMARTYADLPVLIDVLANDVNADGLRTVDVTTPKRGTTMVCDGLVRYAPAPHHRGCDTFNYAVVLDDGRTARARVTVMVPEWGRGAP